MYIVEEYPVEFSADGLFFKAICDMPHILHYQLKELESFGPSLKIQVYTPVEHESDPRIVFVVEGDLGERMFELPGKLPFFSHFDCPKCGSIEYRFENIAPLIRCMIKSTHVSLKIDGLGKLIAEVRLISNEKITFWRWTINPEHGDEEDLDNPDNLVTQQTQSQSQTQTHVQYLNEEVVDIFPED